MKIRLTVCVLFALLASFVAIPAAGTHAQSAPPQTTTTQHARLAFTNAIGHTFATTTAGTYVTISSVTPWRFATLNGKTTLVGTMSGTVTVNGASKPFTSTFDWTVTQAAATCPVLFLVLGPLNLNLLGLHLVTNQIIVNVYADPNGGLLGSLLCGLANLLGPGPTSAILQQLLGAPLTNLLNAILGLL